MKFLKLSILCLLLFNLEPSATSQSLGGLNTLGKWNQIKTENYRLIFRPELLTDAQRVAQLTDALLAREDYNLGPKHYNFDLVIQNEAFISNGFVGLAPFRSYFFTTPPQNHLVLSNTKWMDVLTIHELRHVQQLSNMRWGISNIIATVFGESAWSGTANILVPDWFLEGDAVIQESDFSNMGRGRMPIFMQDMRAMARSNRKYSYSLFRNRSIDQYIPSQYELGYLLVDYVNEKFGSEVWDEVLRETGRLKSPLFSFSGALKRNIGMTSTELYQKAWEELKLSTITERSKQAEPWGDENGDAFYRIAHPQHNGENWIYMLRSFEETPVFYERMNGKSKKIIARPRSTDDYFDVDGRWLAWSEYYVNTFRSNHGNTQIVLYNTEEGKRYVLNAEVNRVSPNLNVSEKKIAAIVIDEAGKSSIEILDWKGNTIQNWSTSEMYLSYPQWTGRNTLICVAKNTQGLTALVHIDPQDGFKIDTLTPFNNNYFGIPRVDQNKVYVSTSFGNVEDVISVDIETKSIHKVTNSINGAFNPFRLGDTIFYTSWTPDGYRVYKEQINEVDIEIEPIAVTKNILNDVSTSEHKIEPYRSGFKLFNFHSLNATFDDSDQFGAELVSTNTLNTAQTNVGLRYYTDDRTFEPYVNFTYAGFVPNIVLEFATRERDAVTRDNQPFSFREYTYAAGLSKTIFFNKGLSPALLFGSVLYEQTLFRGSQIRGAELPTMRYDLIFRRSRLRAQKQIITPLGQFLSVRHRSSINDLQASQWRIESAFSLPAPSRTHNILLTVDYQWNQPVSDQEADYMFGNDLDRQLGTNTIVTQEGITASAQYHFPIYYPNWGISGIAHFYRLRGAVYGSYGSYRNTDEPNININAVGFEFIADMQFLNVLPLSLGVRYGRAFGDISGLTPQNRWEFFIPVTRL